MHPERHWRHERLPPSCFFLVAQRGEAAIQFKIPNSKENRRKTVTFHKLVLLSRKVPEKRETVLLTLTLQHGKISALV